MNHYYMLIKLEPLAVFKQRLDADMNRLDEVMGDADASTRSASLVLARGGAGPLDIPPLPAFLQQGPR